MAVPQQVAAQDNAPAPAPEQPQPAEPEVPDDAIVITGNSRSVVGDVPAEDVLDARDIRATGATSVAELLEALAPQLGSAQGRGGGRPVLLVDGKRISGFRELRDLPAEAIERVEIFPEEVALKYGYRADQRVVNFVLRENFFSTTIETEGRFATDGGRAGGEFEVDRLILSPGKRTTFNFQYEVDGALTEDERDIALDPVETFDGDIDPRPFRTLTGSSEELTLGSVIKRPLGEATGTINLEFRENTGQSLLGPSVATLGVPADSPFADGAAFDLVRDAGLGPLARDRRTRTGSAAFVVNSAPGDWRWSTTGSLEYVDSRTRTDRGPDTAAIQADLDTLDAGTDPFGSFTFAELTPRDEAVSQTLDASFDGLFGGTLFELPAGDVAATFRGGLNHLTIDSRDFIAGIEDEVGLERTRLFATANLDFPLLDNDSPIGALSVSFNGEVEEYSDFGTLTLVGTNVNWRPTGRLRFLGSYTREEGAPSLSALGSPVTVDPQARLFDFVTGETVIAETRTGGNPDLLADTREVWKLGFNYELPIESEDWDVSLRADYVSSRIDNPVSSFPALTAEIENAFPDRFERDLEGNLLSVDLTPVNFAERNNDVLRWGFNFSKAIRPKPPSAETIQAFRERAQRMRAQAGNTQPLPDGQQGPPGAGRPQQQQVQGEGQQQGGEQQANAQQSQQQGPPQARGGGGGFGRFGSSRGPRGGRLYASITHEVTFSDELLIAPGLPPLDYLDGQATSRFGGTSRHRVEGRFGLFNNGFGARVSVDWRSATEVDSGIGPLQFDDYGTVDLRLYANLTERLDVMARHPWLRGTSLRLGIDNVLNERPRVTNGFGDIPVGYEPDLLAPEGRVISFEIRKLFIPRQFMQQEMRRRGFGG
nr:TonB-dependent receptor [Sphingomicrobium sediminis]